MRDRCIGITAGLVVHGHLVANDLQRVAAAPVIGAQHAGIDLHEAAAEALASDGPIDLGSFIGFFRYCLQASQKDDHGCAHIGPDLYDNDPGKGLGGEKGRGGLGRHHATGGQTSCTQGVKCRGVEFGQGFAVGIGQIDNDHIEKFPAVLHILEGVLVDHRQARFLEGAPVERHQFGPLAPQPRHLRVEIHQDDTLHLRELEDLPGGHTVPAPQDQYRRRPRAGRHGR